jgi:hypothetical protein
VRKTDSPGVLRAGAGDAIWRFYAQHALSLEGNSKGALSVLDLVFSKVQPVLHANHKHVAEPDLRAAVTSGLFCSAPVRCCLRRTGALIQDRPFVG